MSETIWIILAIALLLLLLCIFAWMTWGIKKKPTDYYSLFIIGTVWLFFGIASGNSMFWMLGLAFMAVGLSRKSDWKKNPACWSGLAPESKKTKRAILVVLVVLVLLGLLAASLAN